MRVSGLLQKSSAEAREGEKNSKKAAFHSSAGMVSAWVVSLELPGEF